MSVAFSPKGQHIVSAANDHTLRLWDAATGQSLRVLEGHQGAVQSVAFSPKGQHIVSAGRDGTLRLWQTDGQELLRLRAGANTPSMQSHVLTQSGGAWVALDFRQDPRGLWSGQGDVVDTVRYVDSTELTQPWPWVPRYWRASDLPEMRADDSLLAHQQAQSPD